MQTRWIGLVIAGLLLIAGSVAAAETPSGGEYSFRLEPGENDLQCMVTSDLADREIEFKKEPPYEGRRIVRGVLPTGKDQWERTGFAWDTAAGKLYLDLNRNRDLTDDPGGVFQESNETGLPYFKNVRLTLGEGHQAITYLCDMSIGRGMQGRGCLIVVRSGWEGQVSFHGKLWRMAIKDALDGSFGATEATTPRRSARDAFRFEPASWEEQGLAGAADLPAGFPPANQLFFDGLDHEFSFAVRDGALEVSVKESKPPLGALTLEGQYIKCLVLNGVSCVLLDEPGASMQVPAGIYGSIPRIVVADGRDRVYAAALYDGLKVPEGGSAVLKCGGPLDEKLTASPCCGRLVVDYALVGRGQERYERIGEKRTRPQLRIAQGDTPLLETNFDYG